MTQTIAIVDYGMGNLRSVYQAFHRVAPSANILIATTPEQIQKADRVVLPGQGAMPDCMKQLTESGLLEALLHAAKNKPMLGVCVGEQMLLGRSSEVRSGEQGGSDAFTPCLGLIPGEVRRFELAGRLQADGSEYKVPHMGWNQVRQDQDHPLWAGIPDLTPFYFVHSFYAVPENKNHTIGSTEYGTWFTSAIARDTIFATQFHPEKSAEYGLRLYQNFTTWQP